MLPMRRMPTRSGCTSRPAATGPTITLTDVAELDGEYAETLGELVVGRFADGQDELTVQLATVRRVLTESQANWSDLSLRGRSRMRGDASAGDGYAARRRNPPTTGR